MKRITVLFVILIMLFLSKYLTGHFDKVIATQSITYIPENIKYPLKYGECNQLSVATQGRPNTYRCVIDNKINDPCFKLDSGKIICDSNPKLKGDEFELIIEKDLPKPDSQYKENKRFDWAYELEAGDMCFLIQGTATTLDTGEMAFYGCEDNKIIIGDVNKDSNQWVAEISKDDSNSGIEERQLVNVQRSWK